MPLEIVRKGWEDIVRQVVENDLVPRAERIAEKCNEDSAGDAAHKGTTTDKERRGYRAGTQGDFGKPLSEDSYRATVMTVTNAAAADNGRHDRLLQNMHLGGEGE